MKQPRQQPCQPQRSRWLLAACLAAFLPLACAKSTKAASPAPAESAPASAQGGAQTTTQSAPEGAERSQAASIRTPPATRSATPAPSQPLPPPATPATSAELLQSDRPAPLPARDFKIGSLHVAGAAPTSTAEAAALITRFLDGLTRGAIPPELLEAASSDRLTRTVAYYKDRGALPLRYRVGRLAQTADGLTVANVRLFSAVGVAEGEIYLARAEDGFRVRDVQVGFAFLAESYTPPAEPYVPSSYEYRSDASGADGE